MLVYPYKFFKKFCGYITYFGKGGRRGDLNVKSFFGH
jgi:hypothetical protein